MNNPALKIIEKNIQDEANRLQHLATAPESPVWVSASAGSGKTTVLVNRLLRLMLPSRGRAGTLPTQILCITFTKAGASEVMERVVRTLRSWAVEKDDVLTDGLTSLLEETPDEKTIQRARALFANVIEAAGGMKIMTIHAFCESVLARFPMEAGLPAGFEVMDENEAKSLMRNVRRHIITRLRPDTPDDRDLKNAFDYLSAIRSAGDIEDLMEHMMSERGRLRGMLQHHGGIAGLCTAVDKTLNVDASMAEDAAIAGFFNRLPEDALRVLLPILENGLSDDRVWHDKLAKTLASPLMDRVADYTSYKSIFLKDDGDIRTFYRSTLKKDDAHAPIWLAEAQRAWTFEKTLRDIRTAHATRALLRFSAEVLTLYEAEKRKQNRLDFEDLIDRTKRLLSGDRIHWVQYKLDGGIDHILVDEAQDTNPDQWDIITALYDEFYAGNGMRDDLKRTTFVVGDEKQSIFSFQRADPRVFSQMHDRLETMTRNAEMPLQTLPMKISFRASPSILRMVDKTFSTPEMCAGVLQNPAEVMRHDARNTGKAGKVELWPLIKKPVKPPRTAWALPLRVETGENPVTQMAETLALKIKSLLNENLESRGRKIRPGDIMILLAKR